MNLVNDILCLYIKPRRDAMHRVSTLKNPNNKTPGM